jgi:SM-20-related protein
MLVLGDQWRMRRAQERPYRWLSTVPGELFGTDVAAELAETFPGAGFARKDAAHRLNGKTYRNFSRPVGEGADDELLPVRWAQLLTDLCSTEYRQWVAAAMDQELADRVELRLVRHAPGDWLGPHTDREDKLFSHILYFNPGWRAEWGGCLEILDGASATAVVSRVVPELGASALLAQAGNSWHQVTKVSTATAASRRSLLVHGLRG